VVKDLNDGLALYYEVARSWLLKSIKNVLINLVTDTDLDFNILEEGL